LKLFKRFIGKREGKVCIVMLQGSSNTAELSGKSGAYTTKAPLISRLLSVYNQILRFGLEGISDKNLQKHIRFTNLLAVNTLIGSILYLLAAAVFSDNFYWMNAVLALSLTCGGVLAMNARGKTSLSRPVFLLGFNMCLFLSALFIGPAAQTEEFLMLAIIIPFLIYDLRDKTSLAVGTFLPLILVSSFDYSAPYFTAFNLSNAHQVILYKAGVAMQFALVLTCIYNLLIYIRKTEKETALSKNQVLAQENELKRYQAETEQLAYVISHDLRAPVRNVTSFMNLLAMKHAPALSAEAREFIEYSRTGSKRMERLIEDLVVYCRLGTNLPPVAPVNMNDLVTKIKFELGTKIKNAANAISVNGTLPVVNNVHAVLIQQLMQHLITNGLKFNKSEKPEIVISGTETPAGYSFWVRDNGIGISQEYATAIYLIFKRLHGETEYDGIGTGLAVCKKIVELYQGEIWFESQPDKGTTFHFTIAK
jgi:signal transduction histidine kinase